MDMFYNININPWRCRFISVQFRLDEHEDFNRTARRINDAVFSVIRMVQPADPSRSDDKKSAQAARTLTLHTCRSASGILVYRNNFTYHFMQKIEHRLSIVIGQI